MIEFGKKLKYEYITEKWDDNLLSQEFDDKLDKWLNQFDINNRKQMLRLLEHFYYYTENIIRKQVVDLNNKFKNNNMINIEEIVYAPVYKEYGVAYSNIYYVLYWHYNSLYGHSENNLEKLLINNQVPKIIVIVDDFSGSGKTLIDTLEYYINLNMKIKESKIFISVLHITTKAYLALTNYASVNNLDLEIMYLDTSDKAFEKNHIYSEYDCKNKRMNYIKLCQEKNVGGKYMLGFKNTESLVSFEYNTPNNTLGLFWHEDDNFIDLFNRHKKSNTKLREMQNQAMINERIRKQGTPLKGINEGQLNYFMVYCIIMDENLSLIKAKKYFGLTPKQLDGYLNEMFNKGYMYYKNGKPCASDKLKESILTNKIKESKKIYSEIIENKNILLSKVNYIPPDFEKKFSGYKKSKEKKNKEKKNKEKKNRDII